MGSIGGRGIFVLLCVISLACCTYVPPKVGKDPLPGCTIFHDNQCSGDQIITPDSFEARRWFTPRRGDANYLASYQDMALLVGFTEVRYNADQSEADVEVIATHRYQSTVTFTYLFDGVPQTSSIKHYRKNSGVLSRLFPNSAVGANPVKVQVQTSDGAKLELEAVDFVWNAQPLARREGDYRDGQKGAIVEMFGWPYKDIEAECPTLAKLGYMGVKVFPPQESVLSWQPFNNVLNPWYFFYQPISYRLSGRAGSRDALRKMIQTCRAYGVRVYADAVINHMVGGGNDANPNHRNEAGGCTKWGAKNSTLSLDTSVGANSPSYTQCFTYTYGDHTDQPPSQEFPAAAWGPTDFHCERSLNSWTDPLILNAGWLSGLVDLNTEKPYVQRRLAAYLTDILSIGFSGFRIDAAKHMHPADIAAILGVLRTNMGGTLPKDFITWLEVLLGGEGDLLMCNPASPYSYSVGLTDQLKKQGLSDDDINKVKIWNSGYPKETDKGTCFVGKWRSAIQNDDADQQMPGSSSRDMGSEGCVLIKSCNSIDEHRQFEVKLFTNPNGASDNQNDFPIRMVLSSYYFPTDNNVGIPDGLSDCSKCQVQCTGCISMAYQQAYRNESRGYDGVSEKFGYTRAHRDQAVVNAMRSWVKLPPL